jgi:hypothetical protein
MYHVLGSRYLFPSLILIAVQCLDTIYSGRIWLNLGLFLDSKKAKKIE